MLCWFLLYKKWINHMYINIPSLLSFPPSPLQGKEQQLCFAGAAREEIPHAQGKRNPSKMVGAARGHHRADTLKLHSQNTSQSITLGPQPCRTK